MPLNMVNRVEWLIVDIFDEYDVEGSGRMHFRQFIDLMSGWKNRFGMGAEAMAYKAMNTGVIGRARRAFNKWWDSQKLAQERIDRIKARREAERLKTQQLAATFLKAEDIKLKREQQMAERAARASGGGSEATESSGGVRRSPVRTSKKGSETPQTSPLSPGGVALGGLSPIPRTRGRNT